MFVGINFSIFLSFLHYILYVIFVNSSLYIFMNTLDKIYSYECFGQKLRFSWLNIIALIKNHLKITLDDMYTHIFLGLF